jgi:hypothetical protein
MSTFLKINKDNLRLLLFDLDDASEWVVVRTVKVDCHIDKKNSFYYECKCITGLGNRIIYEIEIGCRYEFL